MEAEWSGASGNGKGRVGDIGRGGCFVETLAEPVIGERTRLLLKWEGPDIQVEGLVRQIDRGVGFSLEFDGLSTEDAAKLDDLLSRLANAGG